MERPEGTKTTYQIYEREPAAGMASRRRSSETRELSVSLHGSDKKSLDRRFVEPVVIKVRCEVAR